MGPPGYPPAPKSGPPIALLVGGGCGLIAIIGVVLLVVLVAVGSSSSRASADSSTTPTNPDVSEASSETDDPTAMDGAVFKGIPSTNVEVPVPPGWREDKRSLYTFALSGDGNAVLAFTTVSSVGEFTGRLQHATRSFNITNCSMGDATRVTLGPDRLRARLKEGECNFNDIPSHVAVVLVETGQNALPLVIYAVDQRASKRTVTQAQQTIVRMRSR